MCLTYKCKFMYKLLLSDYYIRSEDDRLEQLSKWLCKPFVRFSIIRIKIIKIIRYTVVYVIEQPQDGKKQFYHEPFIIPSWAINYNNLSFFHSYIYIYVHTHTHIYTHIKKQIPRYTFDFIAAVVNTLIHTHTHT